MTTQQGPSSLTFYLFINMKTEGLLVERSVYKAMGPTLSAVSDLPF